MVFINKIISLVLSPRFRALDNMRTNGIDIQVEQFGSLITSECEVEYLQRHSINKNTTYEEFRKQLPIVSYEDVADDLKEAIRSGRKIVCTDPIRWVAKSSGTTNDTSKYIPINRTFLDNCHYMGGKDVLVSVIENYPETKAYSGKSLTIGGSHTPIFEGSGIMVGDLSATLISNTPYIAELLREPSKEIALMSNFEEKVEAICKSCTDKNITSFAGVPSWNMVLMKRILEYTGKSNLLEVWPDLSLFIHGGIAFEPYREQYRSIIPTDDMIYTETYNASEGFFAIQDTKDANDGMLLMLDYGVFYEFLPTTKLSDPDCAVPLWGVQKGVAYAMIISTNSGLWRYMIGDTVEFVSLNPYRIKIVGRTKLFINAFGEELMVGNAESGIAKACAITGARVSEYTVAPIFMEGKNKGAHEWVIEFAIKPTDAELFADILDNALQELNSDYKAKRANNATMERLRLHVAPKGSFYRWMVERGKVGGQNKVPRLWGQRTFVDQLKYITETGR